MDRVLQTTYEIMDIKTTKNLTKVMFQLNLIRGKESKTSAPRIKRIKVCNNRHIW